MTKTLETRARYLNRMRPGLFEKFAADLIPVGLPTTITIDVCIAAVESSIQEAQHQRALELAPKEASDYVIGREFETEQKGRAYLISAIQFYKFKSL